MRGVAHERINSGFIAAFGAAYPAESIAFYAQRSHIAAVRKTLEQDGDATTFKAIPMKLPSLPGRLSVLQYKRLLRRMFMEVVANGIDRIFFLSFDPETMLAIKMVKGEKKEFQPLKFAFVLHGCIESFPIERPASSQVVLPQKAFPKRTLFEKLGRTHASEWFSMAWRSIRSNVWLLPGVRDALGVGRLTVRTVIELDHSFAYRYVTLAPHALRNVVQYMPPERYNVFNITMPVKMASPKPESRNRYAKFAIYGNADPLFLRNVLVAINQRKPRARYEIRVIGRNHFAAEGIANVKCFGDWGSMLDRVEMEHWAADVDFFLMLFDENKYRLTCSGTMFEAFSLLKPMIYFHNQCIDQFAGPDRRIGIGCYSFEEFVSAVIKVIEDYDAVCEDLAEYRRGLFDVREELFSRNVSEDLRLCFEWW